MSLEGAAPTPPFVGAVEDEFMQGQGGFDQMQAGLGAGMDGSTGFAGPAGSVGVMGLDPATGLVPETAFLAAPQLQQSPAAEPVNPHEALQFVRHSVSGNSFDLPARYVPPLRLVGAGAYGVVVAATDSLTGTTVAVKRIANCFQNLKDTKRIVREIRLMRHFNHENVLPVTDVFVSKPYGEFSEVYIVSPLMDSDLQQIVGSEQELTDDHCQYFIYQVLRGMKAIHSAHVLHRDLKPSNLILNGDCQLKICDLGLARVANPSDDWTSYLTEYVATRWYRAPEVILSWKRYTKAIDVWSVGCIFAELLSRRPLFPGSSYIHQISAITDVLGTPPEDEIANIHSEPARRFIRQLGFKPKIAMAQLHPAATPLALDLLEKLLQFDPAKRITVEEALEHPYLAGLHDGSDEPEGVAAFNFDFEDYELKEDIFRMLLWQEMLMFHPEIGTPPM